MIRSLRSRLVLGMLLGLALLLAAAGTAIYTVQRRHLYDAFDETLLGSVNALSLLVHPGPFGRWFDSAGLERLPTGQIREGALFQIWSDQPINMPFSMADRDAEADEKTSVAPAREDNGWEDDGPAPDEPPRFDEPFFDGEGVPRDGPSPRERWSEPPRRLRDEPGLGSRPARPPRGPAGPWRWRGSTTRVIRSASLGESDLPCLEAGPGRPRFERVVLPDGRRGRAVGVQFQGPNSPPGFHRLPAMHLSVVVAADTAELDHQLRFLGMLLAATAVCTMAVAGGVSWLVVSRGLRPLGAVARAIAAMDESDLKQRIPRQGVPREIDPVVKQLNGLLARLDAAFERERTLTADVAHELRTPVAEIRTIAEVTLNRDREAGEYREALGEALTVTRTLQGLIERLLVLARLESGQMRPDLQPVALQPLLSEFGMLVHAEAERRGVSFDNGCPPAALVLADPMLLEVVLSNALLNAAAYTPDGGRVEATAERTGPGWRFSVANTGCELKPEEAVRVFDRFWRADAARGKSGLNCGLGLTLVRRAMEAMGGAAEALVTDDRRFVLSLTLPAAPDHDEAPVSSEPPDVDRSVRGDPASRG